MNTKNRFGEDKKINEVYEKVNSTRFRNYIYDFDNKGTCCDYIDDYECKIDDLIYENQELKNQQKEFIEYLENEKNRLAKECSHTYEDSLGKLLYVNEDIFNEVNKILSKYKEIIGGDNK